MTKPFHRMKDDNGRLFRDSLGRYRYDVYIRVGGRGTRKVHRRMWFHKDDEVHVWIAKQRSDPAANSLITWAEGFDQFAEAHERNQQYLTDMRRAVNYIAVHCGQSITKTTHAAFAAAIRRKAAETTNRTANLYRSMTLSVARWLRSEGIISTIPFDKVGKREDDSTPLEPFDPDDLPAYAAALPLPARLLWLGLAACGERVSALANALYTDIDGPRGWLWVTKKGGKRRLVPINRALQMVLEQALKAMPEVEVKDGKNYVFRNNRGKKWTAKQFDKTVKAAFLRAGLEPKTPHQLRHMVGSGLADANTSRDVISATLGHEHTSTAEIYVRGRKMDKSASMGLRAWDETLLGHISGILGG